MSEGYQSFFLLKVDETSRNDEKRSAQPGQPKENQNHLGSTKDTHRSNLTISNCFTAPSLATCISHQHDKHHSHSNRI
ncbi:hypothetical protein PGT21_015092 [Puccinia graminis f. sp. tritici]|uniref:Uncharacterized protein n=1 Tax=Puccinia graminis f. sp. tritici TaxID=56615 RepID=A0A5B0N0N1_PUCGR|nr:hypothetical protein PGT21_015092 [Puccinia graminis f. sp. tritici]